MPGLAIELLSFGFPFSRCRADAVAGALVDGGVTRLLDLKGVAHELPLRKGCASLPLEEVKWLVNLALKLSAEKVAAVGGVGLKRARQAPNALQLAVMTPIVGPARDELGVAVCGSAKASRLLDVPDSDIDNWLDNAKVSAILGGCPRSGAERRSALRAYAAFVR